jgi:hypothetical protein
MKPRQLPPRHPDAEGGPKYVVSWQTEFDNEHMTPQQAGIEAWRQIREGEGYMHVVDLDTNRQWDVGMRNHELEVIETRDVLRDGTLRPIRRWDPILKAYVTIEE